jgi:hypothetical protein
MISTFHKYVQGYKNGTKKYATEVIQRDRKCVDNMARGSER